LATDEHRSKRDPLTEFVPGAAFEVSNVLGAGFLEKVYERSLARELAMRGLQCETQVCLPVRYKGSEVGACIADVVVENTLVVEIKCVERFAGEHVAQCLDYFARCIAADSFTAQLQKATT
jgi:GxxExxY protein